MCFAKFDLTGFVPRLYLTGPVTTAASFSRTGIYLSSYSVPRLNMKVPGIFENRERIAQLGYILALGDSLIN